MYNFQFSIGLCQKGLQILFLNSVNQEVLNTTHMAFKPMACSTDSMDDWGNQNQTGDKGNKLRNKLVKGTDFEA